MKENNPSFIDYATEGKFKILYFKDDDIWKTKPKEALQIVVNPEEKIFYIKGEPKILTDVQKEWLASKISYHESLSLINKTTETIITLKRKPSKFDLNQITNPPSPSKPNDVYPNENVNPNIIKIKRSNSSKKLGDPDQPEQNNTHPTTIYFNNNDKQDLALVIDHETKTFYLANKPTTFTAEQEEWKTAQTEKAASSYTNYKQKERQIIILQRKPSKKLGDLDQPEQNNINLTPMSEQNNENVNPNPFDVKNFRRNSSSSNLKVTPPQTPTLPQSKSLKRLR